MSELGWINLCAKVSNSSYMTSAINEIVLEASLVNADL